MNEQARRKELLEQYKQSQIAAGVYRIINRRNNKVLLGSTPNLASVRNKLEFAKSTKTSSALDYRLRDDIRKFGFDAFSLEVLEVLEVKPEMTPAQTQEDLATLEQLWREKEDSALLY